MRVYFVRHGHSVSNTADDRDARNGGDVLTDDGWAQAQQLGQRLAGQPFAAIYSSPQQRAQETAAALADHVAAPLIIHDDLHEVIRASSGYDPKLSETENREHFREHWQRMTTMPPDAPHEDAESFAEIRDRGQRVLAELAARTDDAPVLAVTHGDFLRFLLGMAMRRDKFGPADVLDVMRSRALCTGVSIFEHTGPEQPYYSGWRLVSWMDRAHL